MFCHFLATCSFTTLARADDNIQDCVRVLDPECSGVKANPMLLQHYLQVCKHAENFRRNTAQVLQKDDFGESARSDTITKHFQVVKLELEATLKLEKWDELHNLFEECWKYKSPENLESLADLVLVIQSCVVQANVDTKHQESQCIPSPGSKPNFIDIRKKSSQSYRKSSILRGAKAMVILSNYHAGFAAFSDSHSTLTNPSA
jgi:hypothetical protein